MKKEELVEEFRDTLVAACNKMLDIVYEIIIQLENTEELSEESENSLKDTKISAERYEEVRRKLIDKTILSNFDIAMLEIVLMGNITTMEIHQISITKAIEELKTLTQNLINSNTVEKN